MTKKMTTEEAAKYLGVCPQFLKNDRCTGLHGIPFLKLGRKVLYRQKDLDKYLDEQLVVPQA